MADPEQLERLTRSVQEWNTWRQQHFEIRPDLSDADLRRAILTGANLCNANLRETNFSGANLTWADLSNTNLTWANLRNASLNGVSLTSADLDGANLTGADLNSTNLAKANLRNVNLCGTNLRNTDFTNAYFWNTLFARVDLSLTKGLGTAIHEGPSTVNINSVILPHDDHTRLHFLHNVGFSETLIEYLPLLTKTPTQYRSLFISYSHHNQAFVKRLRTDLQNQGVRCWFAPHDLRPGTPMVRGIEEAIHLHEKLLLILSQHAVNSLWVEHEVEVALYKEVTTGQEVLFPIRLDNTVLESHTQWAKRLRQRHIADFTHWLDEDSYLQAFTTLLRHLKVTKPPTP